MERSPYERLAAKVLCCAVLMAAAGPRLLRAQDANSPANRPLRLPHNLRAPDELRDGPRTERTGAAVPGRPAGQPSGQSSALPPTPPTSAAAAQAAVQQAAPIAATPATTRARRAEVTYSGGQLNVRANDSSLNQILRAICRETGLTITGGVQDQRVFGDYGPASTSSILATLLDGTGTNMLFQEGDPTRPPTLVLTPRGGGPTPPSPTAFADDDPPPAPAAPAPPRPLPGSTTTSSTTVSTTTSGVPPAAPNPVNPITQPNNVLGSPYNTTPTVGEMPTTHSVPLDSLATPATAQEPSGIVDSPNPPGGAAPAPASSSSALTPEAVYQKLLQLQQKNAKQPPTTTTTTPPQL